MSDTDDAVVGESSDAQVDELDSLLNAFDQPDQTGTEPPKVTKSDLEEVVSYVKEDRHDREMERVNADIDSACKTVFEGLPENILPEDAVRGLLIDKADRDPRFQKAFLGRHSNPEAWNKVLGATAKDFSTKYAPVDQGLSDDVEAVASAVRSASTKAPEPPENEAESRQKIRTMSDHDLQMEIRKLGG